MSNTNQIDDFQEFIIKLLFTERQENVFEKEIALHPEIRKVRKGILHCQDYLQEFSDDEKYKRAFFDLDDFQAQEVGIREPEIYKQGVLDGIRICKMLIGK